MPKTLQLTKTKLTFSPNVEQSVSTAIKNKELNDVIGFGRTYYDTSIVETDKRYAELAEELKNDVISVCSADDESIIVKPGSSVATKNATYYYLVRVNINDFNDRTLYKKDADRQEYDEVLE